MVARARWRTLYFLIGVNVLLIVTLVVVLGFVASLRGDVTESVAQQRQACQRGNLILVAVNYNSSIQQSFLAQAAQTREEQAALARKQGKAEEARINEDAASSYRHLATGVQVLPLVLCEVVYPN